MYLARLVRVFAPASMATLVAGTLVLAPAADVLAAGKNITAVSRGTVNVSALAKAPAVAGPRAAAGLTRAGELSPGSVRTDSGPQAGKSTAHLPTVPPNPEGSPVTTSTSAKGFDGVDHRDQRVAGTGIYVNTQFSLEPPDQGLCVGNGFVVEPVNTAMQIYDTSGNAMLSGAVALNQFFGLKPEHDRVTGIFGDFISDPKCLYDQATNRFFLTVLRIDLDPVTGSFGSTSEADRGDQDWRPDGGLEPFQLLYHRQRSPRLPVLR
jgi:hypothetical protein